MKTKTLSFLASIAMLSFASCTDEVQELANEPSQALKRIVMTTQDFDLETGSRTLYEIGEAVKCTWAANDTVGVFPEEGAQAYFPMASGAGTKNATFDGKGWALKDGKTYGAYYPCIGEFYLDRNAVPVSYSGQIQVGNASTAHLGAYDYMVASPAVSEFGSAQFTFKHLSALIQLRITVPQPATLTSVKLVADTEAFAVKGEVDIMADVPSIASVTSSKEIVLNLQDVTTTEENQVVTFYMMLPPADLSEQTLKAVIASDKGTQEIAFEGRNFKAGTAYGLSGEMESTDVGYMDGVVTFTESGTMKQLLGDELLNITTLKVVGPINGDDVICLRQMLGGSEFSNAEKGALTTLDLSEASIVEGGSQYWEYYKTSNDEIGNKMFTNCSNLQNIVLPLGVTSIGSSAFSGCSSLSSVEILDGVTSIGIFAFSGCSSLSSIDIPKGVASIGNSAFSGCSSLISVDIPGSVVLISGSAFRNCSSLTSFDIPDGVTSIDEYVFYGCSSLSSIYIPDGVTSISENAFYDCSSLASIEIPEGVTTIGYNAFRNCSSLASIDIPNGVTSIGYSAFYGCSSLASIGIPDGVTSIDDNTFYGCTSLASIDIPNGVTSIGKYAFCGCSSLASIELSDGVTSIGHFAFRNCSSLISFDTPNGATSIGKSAFEGCTSLTSIDIPAGVTSIDENAFYGCVSLISVYITDLSAWCEITFSNSSSNPLYKGGKLFLNNEELTHLAIPEEIRQIKSYAFCGCKSLAGVTIGDGIISIGSEAFYGCSSLTSVYITDLLAWCNITFSDSFSNPLNNHAKLYLNHKLLTELEIPTEITQIKNYTFYGCDGIKKIIIGKDVTSIGIASFRCYGFSPIYCHATTPPTINSSSANSSFCELSDGKDRTLYVPKGYSSAYRSSDWASFFETIKDMY